MARTTFELQRILVPVDFSGPSELALRYATAFAARFGGKIALLHVIESGRVVGELSESDTGLTEIPRRVEERLRMLATGSGEPALFDKVDVRAGRLSHKIGAGTIRARLHPRDAQPFLAAVGRLLERMKNETGTSPRAIRSNPGFAWQLSKLREARIERAPFSGFTITCSTSYVGPWFVPCEIASQLGRLRMTNAHDCVGQIAVKLLQGAGSALRLLGRLFHQAKPNPQPLTEPTYAPLRIRLPQVP